MYGLHEYLNVSNSFTRICKRLSLLFSSLLLLAILNFFYWQSWLGTLYEDCGLLGFFSQCLIFTIAVSVGSNPADPKELFEHIFGDPSKQAAARGLTQKYFIRLFPCLSLSLSLSLSHLHSLTHTLSLSNPFPPLVNHCPQKQTAWCQCHKGSQPEKTSLQNYNDAIWRQSDDGDVVNRRFLTTGFRYYRRCLLRQCRDKSTHLLSKGVTNWTDSSIATLTSSLWRRLIWRFDYGL